jgi:hypothetical protein
MLIKEFDATEELNAKECIANGDESIVMPNKEYECIFCGNPKPTGMWMAHRGAIFCCSLCASETLPQLMADSIVGGLHFNFVGRPTINDTKERQILLRFYSSFTSALLRRIEIEKKSKLD